MDNMPKCLCSGDIKIDILLRCFSKIESTSCFNACQITDEPSRGPRNRDSYQEDRQKLHEVALQSHKFNVHPVFANKSQCQCLLKERCFSEVNIETASSVCKRKNLQTLK